MFKHEYGGEVYCDNGPEIITFLLIVHLLAVSVSSCFSSCVASTVSSVSSSLASLESGRGIDKLFIVFTWGLPCKRCRQCLIVADWNSWSE